MTRVHGLDLARALALLGMMLNHLGPANQLMVDYLGPANPVSDGYPSALFAVLAGVSMGIIARRVAPGASEHGSDAADNLLRTRFRLVLRGVILFGLGAVLSSVQSAIGEVLTAIGLSYLLLTPVMAWSNRRLSVLLGIVAVFGPLLAMADNVLIFNWTNEWFASLLFGFYPILAWLAYQLTGLLIYRLVVRPADSDEAESGAVRRELGLAGTGLVLLVGVRLLVEIADLRVDPEDTVTALGYYLQGEPHSGGLMDVLGSAGAAMMVIGLCLLICRVGAVVWVTYPLRAMGSMSLTVYVVHVVASNIGWGTFLTVSSIYAEGASDSQIDEANLLWVFDAQALGFLIFASLWRWAFRRGPLEWVMHRMIEGAVRPSQPAIAESVTRSTHG